MLTYYCKNCNNIVGKWNNEFERFDMRFCNYKQSKNFYPIDFLDCKNCNKFVGIECWYVCENCFGENK